MELPIAVKQKTKMVAQPQQLNHRQLYVFRFFIYLFKQITSIKLLLIINSNAPNTNVPMKIYAFLILNDVIVEMIVVMVTMNKDAVSI